MAMLIMGVTVGCGEKEKPKPKPAAAEQPPAAPSQPETPPEPSPEAETGEEPPVEVGEAPRKYYYDPIRADGKPKRNPFVPISIIVIRTLQYEVSQMGVNGVILHGVKKGSVVTPDCKTTFVRINDPIGIHDGSVVDISLEGVLVKEAFMDVAGNIQWYERLIPNRCYPACNKCQ